jgi:hypothetical protein
MWLYSVNYKYRLYIRRLPRVRKHTFLIMQPLFSLLFTKVKNHFPTLRSNKLISVKAHASAFIVGIEFQSERECHATMLIITEIYVDCLF